jgi:hypothetical protein
VKGELVRKRPCLEGSGPTQKLYASSLALPVSLLSCVEAREKSVRQVR